LHPPFPEREVAERQLFEGGPPNGLQTMLGLMSADRPNIRLRVVVAICLGWVPLFVLTALQSIMLADGSFHAFLTDYAVLSRSVIAVSLLILAEQVCLPRLSNIVRYIRGTELVQPTDIPAFDRALKSTLKLRDSMWLEVALLSLVGVIVVTMLVTLPPNLFPPWHRLAQTGRLSPAAWWHALVSVPILVMLLLGWLWRLALWARFMWLVSRLPLRVVPAHPDGAGGLRFLGMSVPAFASVAFAFGVIIAGTVANRVVHDGANLLSFRYVVIGFDVLCLVLFVCPMLAFTPQLLEAWRRGAQEYGALARRLGLEMERKWLNRSLDADALDANDFSATTDLYAIAANAYSVSAVPVSLRQILMLAIGAVLPFVPIVLVAVPPQVLWQKLSGLLF
jgi:hypothetical protein